MTQKAFLWFYTIHSFNKEGVADLVESLSESKYLNSGLNGQVTIYWREKENAGDEEKHWKSKTSQIMIEHKTLDLITRDHLKLYLKLIFPKSVGCRK